MSSNTPNLGLLKKDPMVDGNETFNIETMLNDNWDKIDEAVGQSGGYGVTTQPAANAYEVTLSPAPTSLAAGLRVTIKADTASTGAPTLNVNGLGAKPALKTSGTPASFKANGVYTLVYDGTAFILQGEGGEVGTATAPDVLAGKTFPGEDGLISGTMPNYSRAVLGQGYSQALSAKGDGGGNIVLEPKTGYYEQGKNTAGFGSILTYDPNYKSENIKAGASIFGVPGKSTVVDTADGHADSNTILSGYNAYSKGVKYEGNMPNRSAENHHMPGVESTVWSGDRFFIRPPLGYYNGATWVTAPVPGLTPENLKAGVNVAGLVGTLDPSLKIITGNANLNTSMTISNIPFKPRVIILEIYAYRSDFEGYGHLFAYLDSAGKIKQGELRVYAWPNAYYFSDIRFDSNSVYFKIYTTSLQRIEGRDYIIFG